VYQFVENLKSDRAFFFARGGTALYALLSSMGVGPGDEVILPVFTCPAVPYPVVRLKATPVYADIDPSTCNLDPGDIETKITKRTKVIIVQHTYGIPAEMDPILDIACRHNVWVIEDSCHALGSKYRGQEVGTLGDAAIYSFGWYKPIVLGVGGAAVVNNPELRPNMEKTYDKFTTPSLKELGVLYLQYFVYSLSVKPSRFWFLKEVYRRLSILGIIAGTSRHKRARTNQDGNVKVEGKRIIPFQRRRLFRKLDHWDDMVARQRWIVSQYEELLSQVGYASLQLNNHLEPVYYKYPLLFDCKREIFEQAPEKRIEISYMFGSPLYPPDRRARWKALGYEEGMCPISEDMSDSVVALPVHAKVQARDIKRTVAFLASFQ
jgi:perosamine synthetase